MINTISLEEAVNICPAINTETPSPKASGKYKFISTRRVLDKALENDWLIHSVKRDRNGIFGRHSISLIHKNQKNSEQEEGFPRLNLINSHDLSKRFTFALGFYRLVCSNGLIAPSGLHTFTSLLHRQNSSTVSNEDLCTSIQSALGGFDLINRNIKEMKERFLSKEEQLYLSRFAYYIRFRYRMMQPSKTNPLALLQPRRESDNKNDLWTVFNTIQENITLGGRNIGRGITQFQDDIRFNQEMWSGAAVALRYNETDLDTQLKELFPKKPRKKNNQG